MKSILGKLDVSRNRVKLKRQHGLPPYIDLRKVQRTQERIGYTPLEMEGKWKLLMKWRVNGNYS